MTRPALLEPDQWRLQRREALQVYEDYRNVVVSAMESVAKLTANLADAELLKGKSKAGIMGGARRLAEAGLQTVTYGYSAGHALTDLAHRMADVVAYWETFAAHDLAFDQSSESDGHLVPHLDLYDTDYWSALQLVCYCILLGHPNLLERVMALLVYQNDEQDALLEDLVAPYLPGRPDSTVYTRQLPYRKTKKIFAAKPDQRAGLMAKYLDEWYEASRREPYHDRHKSSYFPGYWSFEAAAITFILDIDDTSYRDKRFYPKDLVDYARAHSWVPARAPDADGDAGAQRLKVPAGQACPRAGYWFTPARPDSRRRFTQGEVMPDMGGDYGATLWQWDERQSG